MTEIMVKSRKIVILAKNHQNHQKSRFFVRTSDRSHVHDVYDIARVGVVTSVMMPCHWTLIDQCPEVASALTAHLAYS